MYARTSNLCRRGVVNIRVLLNQIWLDFLITKHYLIAAALVFVASWYLGASGSDMNGFLQGSAESMGGIAQKIANSNHPQLYLFLFIFFNNAFKVWLFIFMGAFLGIWPLCVLVINGMMLGYVLTAQTEFSSFELFMKGILPHGILELPAIIIACAYGIRFGGLLIKSFFMLFNEEKRGKAGPEIVHFLKLALPVGLILVIVLFVAAIIESTITYGLMT
jgi:stage II sporulation protein M